MNLTIIIITIVAIIATFISIYGCAKKNRQLILLGFFIYGLLVVTNELREYFNSCNILNLMTAGLFLVQAILAYPKNIPAYNASNKPAYYFAKKIVLALFAINLFGIFYTLAIPELPGFYAAFYGAFCLVSIYVLSQFQSGKFVVE